MQTYAAQHEDTKYQIVYISHTSGTVHVWISILHTGGLSVNFVSYPTHTHLHTPNMQATFVDTDKTRIIGDTDITIDDITGDTTSDTTADNATSDMTTDNTIKIIEAADDYVLARNKIYRNLQDKLIERTHLLERMRYVVLGNCYRFSVLTSTAAEKPMSNWCWHLAQCKPSSLFLTGSRYENLSSSWRRSTANLTAFEPIH